MARSKSELKSAFGRGQEILFALLEGVEDAGGTELDARRIVNDRKLRDQIAQLIISQDNGVTEHLVNYDEYRAIHSEQYVFVGDATIDDCSETETGVKPVRFKELMFDHNPSDQEVLIEAERQGCRQPSRAEAETYIRQHTAEQLKDHPRVGIIGSIKQHLGRSARIYVSGSGEGVVLDWHFLSYFWNRQAWFVFVRQSGTIS